NRSEAISFRLDEDVENNAILIDRPPEVVSDAVDLEENLVQMPLIACSGTSSSEAVGVVFAELLTPTPDRLVAEHDPTCCHHLFHTAKAHAETEVQPNAFRDDLSRERVTT